MPHTVEWYLEHRVLYVRATGIITLEEIKESDADGDRLLAEGDAPIHTIVEHVDVVKVPASIQSIRQAMSHLGHPDMGWIILVSPNRSIWSYVGQIVAQMAMIPFRRFDTMGEALAFLNEADPSLLPLLRERGAVSLHKKQAG